MPPLPPREVDKAKALLAAQRARLAHELRLRHELIVCLAEACAHHPNPLLTPPRPHSNPTLTPPYFHPHPALTPPSPHPLPALSPP